MKQCRQFNISATVCFLLSIRGLILGTSNTLLALPSLDFPLLPERPALLLEPCLSPSQDAFAFFIFLCTFS